jgi:hypothetical protein
MSVGSGAVEPHQARSEDAAMDDRLSGVEQQIAGPASPMSIPASLQLRGGILLLVSLVAIRPGGCLAAGSRPATGGAPLTGAWLLFVLALALLSCLMVLALVPYFAECVTPSGGMIQHRRRLQGFGVPGQLAERLLPHAVDALAPRRLWGVVLALCWTGLAGLFGWAVLVSEPQHRLKNLVVIALAAGGFWAAFAGILWFHRAIRRANAGPPVPEPGRDGGGIA